MLASASSSPCSLRAGNEGERQDVEGEATLFVTQPGFPGGAVTKYREHRYRQAFDRPPIRSGSEPRPLSRTARHE